MTVTALLFVFCSSAQLSLKGLKMPAANTGFRNDIQKVVEDYPHQFVNLRGDVLNTNPQSVEYASRLRPQGTQEAMIVKYSALNKEIYSWQATVLTTEDFEEAAKKYKWLYTQLKGMNVTYVADQYTLTGPYEEPEESLGFATSTLVLHHPPTPLRKLKVEVSMNFEFPEWKVNLLVFEKEREDDEEPQLVEARW